MSDFRPYGPFNIPVEDGLVIRKLAGFWREVDNACAGISTAVGCYIFGIRAAKGVRPWYVGKTEKASFKKEAFEPSKRLIYLETIMQRKKGTPVIYFIAKLTPGGRFAKTPKSGHASISILEELLIGTSLSRNSKLVNKKIAMGLKQIHVPGYMNETPGARSQNAKNLALLLGVAKNNSS